MAVLGNVLCEHVGRGTREPDQDSWSILTPGQLTNQEAFDIENPIVMLTNTGYVVAIILVDDK